MFAQPLNPGMLLRTRKGFIPEMHSALRNICQNGLLGDAELFLLYAFRSPSDGDLVAGILNGHSIHNRLNFGGDPTQLNENYGVPWTDFAESVIPPLKLLEALQSPPPPPSSLGTRLAYPHSRAWILVLLHQSVFVNCCVNTSPNAGYRSGMSGTSPDPIPWDDLHAEPGKVPSQTFVILADKPFRFFSEEQISARHARHSRYTEQQPQNHPGMISFVSNPHQITLAIARSECTDKALSGIKVSVMTPVQALTEPAANPGSLGQCKIHPSSLSRSELTLIARDTNTKSQRRGAKRKRALVKENGEEGMPPRRSESNAHHPLPAPKQIPNQTPAAAKKSKGRTYRGFAIFDDEGNEVDRDGNILVYANAEH
ncbi:hypothetical protein B0H13DRAFT_2417585 [Mycena leptocephala]|nr:hypothetical protein B0H13DRAFT_2417585 [Mycena leptocephala]